MGGSADAVLGGGLLLGGEFCVAVGCAYRVTGVPGVADCSFERLEDAKTWMAKAQAGSWERDFFDPRDGSITLREYVEGQWIPNRTDIVSTRTSMLGKVRNHILPLLGDKSLNQLRHAATLRQFQAALALRAAVSTARTIWTHLSTILAAAVDDKLLPQNPCREHRTIKPPRTRNK
ncbi:hypothetical protein H9Y04_44405 [Streptomyces sp. TRM66268-LWL]|uniref:Integrase n=1 Tax=Streptomyces polyasparticus TaxID=2767826 RepID=A0ABR7SVL4_9ACTN|nr:hypothetical protein [Streptomyces polyasparticus]MBC9719554.1 hypothetical protein [Streptomyces polyasparticus]